MRQSIPSGHKIALEEIRIDAPIFRYGQVIGFATDNTRVGEHVHKHNLGLRDSRRDHTLGSEPRPVEDTVPVRINHLPDVLRSLCFANHNFRVERPLSPVHRSPSIVHRPPSEEEDFIDPPPPAPRPSRCRHRRGG